MKLVVKISSLAYTKGMTLAQLADKAGVPRTMVYDWSRTASPRIGNIMKVAAALEVTLDELMEGVDIPEQSKEDTL